MDHLELEKARQLRKIAERSFPEPVADFTIRRFANGQLTTSAEGSIIEIAMMISNGMHDIEKLYPEARMIFVAALRDYLEG